MRRVASLFLPDWPLDRLRGAGRTPKTSPERPADPAFPPRSGGELDRLGARAAAERAKTCSVPNTPEGRPGALWAQDRDRAAALSRGHQGGNPGWRPGAKWAKAELEEEIARLPLHQRPSMREMGRRSEAAPHPFRAQFLEKGRSDEAGAVPPVRTSGEGQREGPYPGEGAFFLTGRMSGGIVGRACAEDARAPSDARRAVRRPAEPPLVTAHRVDGRDLVHAANEAAWALGIAPGMWLTQARVMAAGLHILPADPEGDRAALHDLAVALARRWAPTVAVSDDTGLFVDLTGVAHLHGGEEAFAERLLRLLARLGYAARLAVADTAGAAWALARRGPAPVVIAPPARHVDAIEPLPVAALRLEEAHVRLLDRLGVGTVAELIRLPRKPLMRRFGGALVRRLDQATGRAPEPLEPVVPPLAVSAVQRFAEPIATPEPIGRWMDILCARLARSLAEAGLGARAVLLVAERIDRRDQRLRIGLARPSRDPAHLSRLFRRRIEEVEPGFGIEAMTLHVLRADPLAPEAIGGALDEALGDGTPDLAPLIDALANRLHGRAPWRVEPVESDVPERSAARVPALAPPDRRPPALGADDVRRLAAAEDDHPWHPRWPRPVRLLPRPEPVEHVLAELPDHPPKRFTWRGRSYRVVRADGPERIGGEWWRRPAERDAVRDYFSVEDEEGRRFWLFRRGDGVRAETGDLSWHLHGTFG
ncbi:Y-family DNA polymerase [Sphingomonas lenta]|uniref:DNA-directed DNA polymerase n=1 Tax=Sphingomonas lenta TaxID=1141887 RepID=A0A2A2SHD6_9SPHN|nr:DNA polymerase Y family protein [Sphingomonas lenta]PAX08666.1 protein ImuB [Sphingomonas lenta]